MSIDKSVVRFSIRFTATKPYQKRFLINEFFLRNLERESFVLKHVPPFLHFKEEATSLVNPVTPSVEPDHRIVDIIPRTVVLLILHPVENIHTEIDASSSTELLQVSKIKLQLN